jgi:inward rectifier potassium channel
MTDVRKQPDDINKDLGLGSRVAQQSRLRFLNRDGSFNVERRGFPFLRSLNVYHWTLTMSWTAFNSIVVAYFIVNLLFAAGYTLCGPSALHGSTAQGTGERFLEAFFFSVQTLATIGYGTMSPHGLPANILVTIEALFGLLGFALATGLLFARFSRPTAKIIFSKNAVMAPYREIIAFEFRIANERANELIEVHATVSLSRNEIVEGKLVRKFYPLSLERSSVVFMPLHWVVVHPIDESSPLHGVTKQSLDESDAEFLILLTAVDETFSQTVHARSSYKHQEVIWGARFADMFMPSDNGELTIDLRKIHEIEKA